MVALSSKLWQLICVALRASSTLRLLAVRLRLATPLTSRFLLRFTAVAPHRARLLKAPTIPLIVVIIFRLSAAVASAAIFALFFIVGLLFFVPPRVQVFLICVWVPLESELFLRLDRMGEALLIVVVVEARAATQILLRHGIAVPLIIILVIVILVIIVLVTVVVILIIIKETVLFQVVLELLLMVLSVLSSFLCKAALEVEVVITAVFGGLADGDRLELRLVVGVLRGTLGILLPQILLVLQPAPLHLLEHSVFFLLRVGRGGLLFRILARVGSGRQRLVTWI